MRKHIFKKSIVVLLSLLLIFSCGMTAFANPDFTMLQKQNPDIYAWLYIPGTYINYPVCQSNNDVYYLKHNSDKGLDANGALYTESAYNGKEFADPVTVIYGHNMRSGRMFGFLQETFQTGLGGHDEAIVYLPGKTLRYKLFAALPVGSNHLLYGRNFADKERYQAFINEILKVRSMEAVRNSDIVPTVNDKLLILSTCMGGRRTDERYIVVGVRTK